MVRGRLQPTWYTMSVPAGFIGTIEDDQEVENDDLDSEEEDVSL